MDSLIHRIDCTVPHEALPTQDTVLTRLDDPVAVVIGEGVLDYDLVEDHLKWFLNEHIDAGVTIVVSEKSNGFIKYLLAKHYRSAVMTVGKEYEFITKKAILTFIVVKTLGQKTIKLKQTCEDGGGPSYLLVTGNCMNFENTQKV